jgi:DNA-binding NtrC family response regulator
MKSKLGDDEIVGRSFAFQQVLDLVRMVANTDSVTLIQGETGTGKELIARAIHQQSLRRQGRFVSLNCAAIPGLCWRANSSATKGARSREHAHKPRGDFRWRMGVPSFWTK